MGTVSQPYIGEQCKEPSNVTSRLLNHPDSEMMYKQEPSHEVSVDNLNARSKFNTRLSKPLKLSKEFSAASISPKSKSPSHAEISVMLQLKSDIRSGSKMSKTHAKLNNSTPEHRPGKNQKSSAFNADLKEWVH